MGLNSIIYKGFYFKQSKVKSASDCLTLKSDIFADYCLFPVANLMYYNYYLDTTIKSILSEFGRKCLYRLLDMLLHNFFYGLKAIK